MAAVTDLKTWLQGQAGITITLDNAPNTIIFTVDHAIVSRKALMAKLTSQNIWLLSRGSNSGLKEYKVADITTPKPTW